MSGEDRIRTPFENTGKTGFPAESGAESGAVGARADLLDPGLAAVVEAWPTLPEATKDAILAMVKQPDDGTLRNRGMCF